MIDSSSQRRCTQGRADIFSVEIHVINHTVTEVNRSIDWWIVYANKEIIKGLGNNLRTAKYVIIVSYFSWNGSTLKFIDELVTRGYPFMLLSIFSGKTGGIKFYGVAQVFMERLKRM